MNKVGNLFILGDSYSTFAGYIPEGFEPYYSPEGREETDVTSVRETWWNIFTEKSNANLVRNCSWSGTTICHTGYKGHDYYERSFVTRFENLVAEGFFEKNHIDTVIVFGGTNDSGYNAPLGEEMYSGFEKEALYLVRPAVMYLAKRIKEVLPNARTVFVINCDIKQEVSDILLRAAHEYGHEVIALEGIDKNCGHPTIKGMSQIADSVLSYFSFKKEK